MDLPVAIGTAAIERPDVKRFSGGSRMARQHMNMALLAQQMNTLGQQLGIVRTMRRVTVLAILADGRMVPEKGPAFFSVAGVTNIIDGMVNKHLPALTAMRIVTGSATNLHIAQLAAKQVRRALEQGLSLLNMAAETSFFDGWAREHVFRQSRVKNLRDLGFSLFSKVQGHSLDQFRMVDTVTRQTA